MRVPAGLVSIHEVAGLRSTALPWHRGRTAARDEARTEGRRVVVVILVVSAVPGGLLQHQASRERRAAMPWLAGQVRTVRLVPGRPASCPGPGSAASTTRTGQVVAALPGRSR